MARTLVSSVSAAEIGKGLPLPTLTTAERNAIVSPTEGFAIYNSTNKGIEIKDQAGWASLVPAGVVYPYAGSSAPDGWLLCDGSAVSRATYARLFAAIGTSFGVGDGSTTFNLPDTQGVFIRGAGSQTISAISYSATNGIKQNDATAKKGLSLSGDTTFASSSHAHDSGNMYAMVHAAGNSILIRRTNDTFTAQVSATIPINAVNTTATNGATIGGITGSTVATGSVGLGAGDAETRPANLGMNHIIKI